MTGREVTLQPDEVAALGRHLFALAFLRRGPKLNALNDAELLWTEWEQLLTEVGLGFALAEYSRVATDDESMRVDALASYVDAVNNDLQISRAQLEEAQADLRAAIAEMRGARPEPPPVAVPEPKPAPLTAPEPKPAWNGMTEQQTAIVEAVRAANGSQSEARKASGYSSGTISGTLDTLRKTGRLPADVDAMIAVRREARAATRAEAADLAAIPDPEPPTPIRVAPQNEKSDETFEERRQRMAHERAEQTWATRNPGAVS